MKSLKMLVVVFAVSLFVGCDGGSSSSNATMTTPQPISDPTITTPPPTDVPYQCDGRQYCSEMDSYEEAKYFLDHCPDTKMDGDNDGIPCETQFNR